MTPKIASPKPDKGKGGRKKNCGRCNKPKSKCKCGRPTVMTEKTISKLEQAFMIGCPDSEACLYAEISLWALYEYQKKNPKFTERKRLLRDHPNLRVRQTLSKDIKTVDGARYYGERKMKDEFGKADAAPIEVHIDLSKEAAKRAKKYE